MNDILLGDIIAGCAIRILNGKILWRNNDL
jgi:hypothetical protein